MLTVGEVAARAGVAVSALRFYEAKGLIRSAWACRSRRSAGRCGCLSMDHCWLRNPGDRLAARGPGPRLLDPG